MIATRRATPHPNSAYTRIANTTDISSSDWSLPMVGRMFLNGARKMAVML
jgi:hypothetical protein